MTTDPSQERWRQFVSAAGPLLDRLGTELTTLEDNADDVVALVSILERFAALKALAGKAGEEPCFQISFGCEELLSAVLCDQATTPSLALKTVRDAFDVLKGRIADPAANRDNRDALPIIEKLFGMLKVPVAQLAGPLDDERLSAQKAAENAKIGRPVPEIAPAEVSSFERETPGEATGGEEYSSKGLPENLDDPETYREFVFECSEHLETIEEKILDLENRPDDVSLINEVFRRIHSLKGGADFLSLAGMQKLAHDTETLLDYCRRKKFRPTSRVIELCLRSVDALKQMTANLSLALASPAGEAEPVKVVVYGPIRRAIRDLLDHPETAEEPLEPESPGLIRLGDILIESGDLRPQDLEEALNLQEMPVGEILVRTGKVSLDRIEKALEKQKQIGGAAAAAVARAVKVDTARIDLLVSLADELATLQARMERMASGNGDRLADSPAWEEGLSQLGRIAKEIQYRTMSLRMTPLRQTFQKMTRLVRDAGKKMKKKINLVITGENIEMDRTVVEQIGDPLVHMLRNCVDHGIETPEERRAAGKPETGRINLNVSCQGDRILIRVKDDGRGLDRDRIIAKAVELGLLPEGANPPDAEVFRFIFAAGFSTAREITSISGRGVGMDVVKRNIERMGGRVEVESKKGKGAAITLSLPLALAAIRGTAASAGGKEGGVPTASIPESFRPNRKAIPPGQ